MTQPDLNLSNVVSREEWRAERKKLLAREKEATRALDALLLDLFDGRRQLVVYHFMFGPNDKEGCIGCSSFVDNIGHLAHLHTRGTSLALVSRAPLDKIAPFKKRMGWTVPWYSSYGSDFNHDFGVTTDAGESFGLSVFIHDGERVFHTYFTDGRSVGRMRPDFNFLDLTPLGRQETWEDSPEGRPQTPPYTWWRHHDQYEE